MYIKLNINEHKVWFISDPHYHQKNIVEGISDWEDKSPCRPFKTLEEHDNTLVKNINACVKPEDTLFCLGDWNFGSYGDSVELAFEFRKRLKCQNIILILGNHDEHIRDNKKGLQGCFKHVVDYAEVTLVEPSIKENVKAIKYKLILSHYAMRTWNHAHRGSYMLYGHSHGTLDEFTPTTANPTWIGDNYYVRNYRTMDVGVDTHPEFRPYSWDEIKTCMEQRGVDLEVDHHTRKRIQ